MRTLCLAAFLLATVTTSARAEDGIVLESYTGARPDNAGTVLEPMLSELATKNFVGGGDGVGLRFESTVSRPAGSVGKLPPNFADQVDQAHKAYFAGKFDDAIKMLVPLVDTARANTGAFAMQPALREKLTKATIALALAYNRSGDAAAAKATLGELVRSSADAQVPKGTYGPEANALFEQVKKELTAGPKGRLLVKLANEDAEVFINERLERTGTTVKELIPGDYRVVVQRRGTLSRNHRVTIKPGSDVTIAVDLPFDAVVHTTGWVGFEFPSDADREKSESTYAQQFASKVGAGGVIVVGFDQVRGRPAVVGSLISTVNGRELRRASLALEPPPSEDRLQALARFLGGEQATPDIDVQISGEASNLVTSGGKVIEAQEPGGRWGGWKWLSGVAAVAGIGAGAYLLKIDGTCPDGSNTSNCPNLYNVTAPAWGTLGAGAVLAGITVYLFVTDDSAQPRARSAFLVPTDGGALAGYATRF
jgi:hypothetical protein